MCVCSLYWDHALSINLDEIVYIHCHRQGWLPSLHCHSLVLSHFMLASFCYTVNLSKTRQRNSLIVGREFLIIIIIIRIIRIRIIVVRIISIDSIILILFAKAKTTLQSEWTVVVGGRTTRQY